MQLVAMTTTILALVQAGQMCPRCQQRNMNVTIAAESCGRAVLVSTIMCEGQCFLEDPLYDHDSPREQKVCNGDWIYERRNIDGCEVEVPVAQNCRCRDCDGESTDCRHMSSPHTAGCPSV